MNNYGGGMITWGFATGSLNGNTVPIFKRAGIVMAGFLFAFVMVVASHAATLVAQYEFEDNTVLTADVSGNGNNIISSFGNVLVTNDAVGGSSHALGAEPSDQFLLPGLNCPGSVAGIFAGDFSVSLWVNTTNGSEGVPSALFAATSAAGTGRVTATVNKNPFNPGSNYRDVLVTFSKAPSTFYPVYSYAAIPSGQYAHIAVVRSVVNNTLDIYINGSLDHREFLSQNFGGITCDQLNFGTLTGDYDDLRFFSGTLTAQEVSDLYQHPYQAPLPTDFNLALNTTNLIWTTTNPIWSIENTTTHDGLAAQSASIGQGQTSALQTAIAGPAQVSFSWKVDSLPYPYPPATLQAKVDGVSKSLLSGPNDWTSNSIYVPPGNHTVSWVASGGLYPAVVGYLDQVTLGPAQDLFNPALNTTGLDWTTSDGNGWFVETAVTQDGVSAVQSGAIATQDATSTLQCSITGPGYLGFYYRNDCDSVLEFLVDGNAYEGGLGANYIFQYLQYFIPAGQHTLTWVAANLGVDGAGDSGNSIYLDQVGFTPITNPGDFNISGNTTTNGDFHLALDSFPGFTFTVLTSTNASLPLGSWTVLGAATETGSGHYEYVDSHALTNSQRFYAVRWP